MARPAAAGGPMSTSDKVLAAMRSGEWLRTQWIARVAFDAPPPMSHVDATRCTLPVLRRLLEEGRVERREVRSVRHGDIAGVPISFGPARRMAAGERGRGAMSERSWTHIDRDGGHAFDVIPREELR